MEAPGLDCVGPGGFSPEGPSGTLHLEGQPCPVPRARQLLSPTPRLMPPCAPRCSVQHQPVRACPRCWSATYLPHRARRASDTSGTHSAARQGQCPCLSPGGAAAWGQVPPLKALGTSCGWAGSLVLLPPRAPIPLERGPRNGRWGRAACAHSPGRCGGSRERSASAVYPRACTVHVRLCYKAGRRTWVADMGRGSLCGLLRYVGAGRSSLGERRERAARPPAGACLLCWCHCAARGPPHPSAKTLQGQPREGSLGPGASGAGKACRHPEAARGQHEAQSLSS